LASGDLLANGNSNSAEMAIARYVAVGVSDLYPKAIATIAVIQILPSSLDDFPTCSSKNPFVDKVEIIPIMAVIAIWVTTAAACTCIDDDFGVRIVGRVTVGRIPVVEIGVDGFRGIVR